MFKLALDNQVSKDAAQKLSAHYEVVMNAGDLPDEEWIEQALLLDANIFISPDLDVPNYLDRIQSDARWIDLPQNLRSHNQFDFIMKKIEALK